MNPAQELGILQEILRILNKPPIDNNEIIALLKPLEPSDLAQFIQVLSASNRVEVVKIILEKLDPEFLTWLDEFVLEDIIETIDPIFLANFIDQLESDDALDILELLDEKSQRQILSKIPAEDRALYQDILTYPEDTAARLMRREVVAMPSFWSVGQAIDFLRNDSSELPEQFYNIIVVGASHKPIGVIALSKLICSQRPIILKKIMEKSVMACDANMDQEEVARIFSKYALVETPVVDKKGRLIGSITVDDIVHVIEDEQEKDFMQMGGVQEDDFYQDTKRTIILRFAWLFVNLGTAFLASFVVDIFSATLEKIIALAILMPIVAGMGGNASTQTQTIVVRALATKELISANFWRFLLKEFIVGFANGCLFALITASVVGLWFQDALLGLVIGIAIVINLVAAALAGVLVPIGLTKIKQDPAISTTIFITTITDIIGFVSFLGLASLIL